MNNQINEILNKKLISDPAYQNLADTKKVGVKTIFAAALILKEAGGELRGKDVLKKIEENLKLSDWEKASYEKTGYTRWISILRFYTIDCSKAGFLRRSKGTWYLTRRR